MIKIQFTAKEEAIQPVNNNAPRGSNRSIAEVIKTSILTNVKKWHEPLLEKLYEQNGSTVRMACVILAVSHRNLYYLFTTEKRSIFKWRRNARRDPLEGRNEGISGLPSHFIEIRPSRSSSQEAYLEPI